MLKKLIHHTKIAVLACIFAAPLTATTAQPITEPLAKQSAANTEKAVNKTAKADVAKKTIHLNRKEILSHLNALVDKLPVTSGAIAKKVRQANKDQLLPDDVLTELVSDVLMLWHPKPTDSQETSEHYKALKTAEGLLIKRLKSYHISGFSLAIDPNGACMIDNQDPSFPVAYRNAKGEIKTRKYQASINSIGLKLEFAIKFDLIFFTGTEDDFYNTNKVIELGTGIEVSGGLLLYFLMSQPRPWNMGESFEAYHRYVDNFYTPQEHLIKRFLGNLSLLYVPFTNVSGGLLILGLSVGPLFLDKKCSDMYCGDLSIVTGGTLTPVD